MSDIPDGKIQAAKVDLPARTDQLFNAVFVLSTSATGQPGAPVVAEANAYGAYVRQLALRLEAETRKLAARLSDEEKLVAAAQELMQMESQRRMALQPYVAAARPAAAKAQAAANWRALQNYLRDHAARELEALRDARLRLELRRAEVINQRSAPQVRIVLQGGAQIRLHFGKRAGDASQKA